MPGPREIPTEGSYLRQLYDILKSNKGKPVRLMYRTDVCTKRACTYQSASLEQLRSFYGCEIRKLKAHVFILEGEWVKSHYTDYRVDKGISVE